MHLIAISSCRPPTPCAQLTGSQFLLLLLIPLFGALGMVFSKAGYNFLLGFVPIVNAIIVLRLVGRPAAWVLLALVPVVDVFVYVRVAVDLAHSFGKSTAFGIGMATLPIVFLPILAVGKAKYIGPAAKTVESWSA